MAGKNVFAQDSDVYVKANSTEFKVINSTGSLLVNTAPLGYVETISWSSNGITPSTATDYGLTYINMTGTDPSSSPYVLTLTAPIAGVEKTITLDSTAPYVNTIDIDLGAGVGVNGSTDHRYIYFSTLAHIEQSVTLIGVTTALWTVKSANSTVGGFGTAGGIRIGTTPRTS
jgi:hypothetical protein